jgi:predicted DNA-binding transcriptional regulator AlpA
MEQTAPQSKIISPFSPTIRMMTRREVCGVFGTSSAGLHRGMASGRFPRPYRTGPNSVRWRSDEVQQCIASFQIAEPQPVAPGALKGRKPRRQTEV